RARRRSHRAGRTRRRDEGTRRSQRRARAARGRGALGPRARRCVRRRGDHCLEPWDARRRPLHRDRQSTGGGDPRRGTRRRSGDSGRRHADSAADRVAHTERRPPGRGRRRRGALPRGRREGARGIVTAAPPGDRVRIAASHWKPRFVANGIDANDFDRVLDETSDWRDWAPNWRRVGDEHRALADEAPRARRTVTATEAYQRAAWCYHLGKFLWFEEESLHDEL